MPFSSLSWSRATTPCGSGSCGSIVIAPAGIAAKPKPPSIGCAVPSPAYGSSIHLTSPCWPNDDCQASNSWQPKATRTGGSPLPTMEADRGPSQSCSSSPSNSQGQAVSFSQGRGAEAMLDPSDPDGRGRRQGESPSCSADPFSPLSKPIHQNLG